jgi:hypothetical protein
MSQALEDRPAVVVTRSGFYFLFLNKEKSASFNFEHYLAATA